MRRARASVIVPAVAVVAGAAAVVADGPGESVVAQSVAATRFEEAAEGPVATESDLSGTTWRLTALRSRGATVGVPASSGATLTLGADGRFTLRSCNVLTGEYRARPGRLELRNDWARSRTCSGAAGRIDRLVHAATAEPLRVRRDSTLLRLTSTAGHVLHLRAPESNQPPLDAVEVARVDDARGNCRVLAAATSAGPRLYVLSRIRPGGPWRLLPGPITPEVGPIRTPNVAPLTVGSARGCVAGFVPAGTVRIRGADPVVLARLPALAGTVVVAELDGSRDLRLEAVALDGRSLRSWRLSDAQR